MSDTNDLLERERKRLGGPPMEEEIAAYSRGDLTEDEAARIRALLVVHPEAAGEVVRRAEFEGILSEEEVEEDWQSLRRRIAADKRPRPLWIAIAAVLAAAALAVLLYETVRRAAPRDEPRLHGIRHEIMPIDVGRGPSEVLPYPLPPDEANYLLALRLLGAPPHAQYRLDVVDLRSKPTIIWSGSVASSGEKALEISIPRKFLDPGVVYQLDLRRAEDAEAAPVASYRVRVEG